MGIDLFTLLPSYMKSGYIIFTLGFINITSLMQALLYKYAASKKIIIYYEEDRIDDYEDFVTKYDPLLHTYADNLNLFIDKSYNRISGKIINIIRNKFVTNDYIVLFH